MIKPYLFVDHTVLMGRGVFTSETIEVDTIVEISPVIVMGREDRAYLDKTLLHDYIFEWGQNTDKCCMALGLIPIYNHSYNSNCEYIMDYEEDTIEVKAVRQIAKGEELTINYNGDCNDKSTIWFDAK
jgi:hypothetical protein